MDFYKDKKDKELNYIEINTYKKKKVLNPNIRIRKNSINLLSELIENNPNYVNEKDKNGNTILFYEIEKNDKENMKLILDVDILDLNIKNKDGDSYLHYAIKNHNYNLIHSLIRKGIDLNIQNNLGNSPLHLAYELNDNVMINILIKNNINTKLKNKKGQIAEEINKKNNNYDLNNNLNKNDDIYFLKRSNTQTNKNINNFNNFDFNEEDFESMNENFNSEELNKSLNKYKYSYSNNINSKFENKTFFSNSDSNKNKINKNYNYKNFPEVSTDFISESLNKKENNEDFFNLDTSIDNIKKENKDKVEINFNMLNDEIKKMYDSAALENIKSNKMKISYPKNNDLPNDLNSNINNNNLNNNDNENDIFGHVKGKSKTTQLLTKITFNLNDNKNDCKKIYDFLLEIKMEKYYNFFIMNGFDDINLIIEQTKNSELGINDKELKEIGIQLPGDRAKILIRIQEKANNFSFKIPENVYYTCEDLFNFENDNNIIKLNKWLENIKCGFYLNNFISNNYFSLELLLIQMIAKNKLTEEILDEMGIYKIGHKIRILNKLKEDVKNLQNNKKLLINNNKDSLFDCKIF